MSDQNSHPKTYEELRINYESYIETSNALYRLKTENEEEINSIYKKIKIELIDSIINFPQNLIVDILNIIPYNNRYLKINIKECKYYSNFESLLVYFDQTNDVDQCFLYSFKFNIQSIWEYFLSQGANINAKDDCNLTIFDFAALNNPSEEAIKFLISHGANINKKVRNGETPLHKAARYNRKETIKILPFFNYFTCIYLIFFLHLNENLFIIIIIKFYFA
ncbi:hypothetical protein TVAG_156630 [Trichomonas vaginalis G3]|uniref:Uncharacterized protein n=1 Tax=Trichomonas vaginalis (strain ATCC PRA-98 / G3) TaxID=412133 RepID=A2FRT5_TRIV3|nr:spectrin binding [Trichomonas vaginalis G3]EAX92384.1 hypothetical protein TVAG_156630 [Trichomonas vaginalis G3]KAI5544559.1 spectrin binding [Trichomonas vaginalis G3]|eukprot:XP_001305314.1 hypothetical protein [Trichomonas vaginalis G3]